jgi:hypothetical protein
MPGITGISAAIKAVIASATGVGKVYDYLRFATQDKVFETIAVTGGTVNFWQFERSSMREQWLNDFQFKRQLSFNISGYLAVSEATDSGRKFQALVDRVAERFRRPGNRDLNATIESVADGNSGGFQVNSIGHTMVHGVFCHSVQGRLQVTENPSAISATGPAASFSGPRIFYANAIGATAMLTISSTSPSFPRSFLIDEARKTPWRSTSLGSPSVTIDIDLGAATNIRSLAILNNNFSAGTYKLYYGATSPATHVVTLTSKNQSLWMSFFATQNKRHWRFSMSEAAIASGFYQIGELWLGNVIDLNKWHEGSSEGHEDGNKEHETDGGVRWRLSGFQRDRARIASRTSTKMATGLSGSASSPIAARATRSFMWSTHPYHPAPSSAPSPIKSGERTPAPTRSTSTSVSMRSCSHGRADAKLLS